VQQELELEQQELELEQQELELEQQELVMVQHGPQMVQALELALCLRVHFHCPLQGWAQNLNTKTRNILKMLNCRSDELQIFISCSLFVYNLSKFINTHTLHRLPTYISMALQSSVGPWIFFSVS
jgi:hypothetical protein